MENFKKEFRKSFPSHANKPIELSEGAKASMKRTQERILQIPHELRPLSLGLAKRGWYINMDMPLQFLFRLRHVLDAGKVDEVDAYMAAYLRHQHETLTAGISETFPARSTVLNAAFEAHRREEYVLSVPIFLAQSDGICEELLGAGFYSRFKGIPKTHSLVQKFKGDAIILALLEPLKVAGALNAYESERHQYPDILNRHEVLHGKSSDYATELNSFRALSLLSYLGTTLFCVKELHEFKEEAATNAGDHPQIPNV